MHTLTLPTTTAMYSKLDKRHELLWWQLYGSCVHSHGSFCEDHYRLLPLIGPIIQSQDGIPWFHIVKGTSDRNTKQCLGYFWSNYWRTLQPRMFGIWRWEREILGHEKSMRGCNVKVLLERILLAAQALKNEIPRQRKNNGQRQRFAGVLTGPMEQISSARTSTL